MVWTVISRLTLLSDTNGMEELLLDNKPRSLDLNLKSEHELAVKELYAGKNVLIWEK